MPGTSVRWPWRSIGRVNQGTYRPGDRILFLGGQTHEGSVVLTVENASGAAEEPVLVSSYGEGRALIASGSNPGLLVRNTGGVRVTELNFEGAAATGSDGAGIHFANENNAAAAPIQIDHVEVHKYATGILITAQLPGRYEGVSVSAVETHDNLVSGLTLKGIGATSPVTYALTKISLSRIHAHHNRGDNTLAEGSRNSSGSGIAVSGVDWGVIEGCVAHNNGGNNPVAGTEKAGGAFAISISGSRLIVQSNEAYWQRAHPSNRTDAGGFLLQATRSFFQYNYSHDNDGPGLLLVAFEPAPPAPVGESAEPPPRRDGNYVRYNISENDGQQTGEGSLRLWGPLEDVAVFNNTIFARRLGETPAPLLSIDAAAGTTLVSRWLHFYNNLFLTQGGVPILRVKEPRRTVDLQFEYNAYVDPAGAYRVEWGERVYQDLTAWIAAARVENHGRAYIQPAGLPLPVQGVGTGGAVFPESLTGLKAYRLIEGSPLIDAGVNLGGAHGAQDFFGTSLPAPEGRKFDIGAHEVISKSVVPTSPN